jgi:CheY-like chemotaxis protein
MTAQLTDGTGPFPLAVSGGRPLVVVAEDRADERALMATLLGLRGFDVIAAADGREALDAVFAYGPDAVVSDLGMPNLDGLGLCRALRALRRYATLPIIVYTGTDVSEPHLRDAFELHRVRVVSKSRAVTEISALLGHMITVARESLAGGDAVVA